MLCFAGISVYLVQYGNWRNSFESLIRWMEPTHQARYQKNQKPPSRTVTHAEAARISSTDSTRVALTT